MFLDAAARLDRPPAMWFYTDGGRVVGETGAIPVRLKVGREVRDAAWLVDSMVLKPYRDQAVGTRILHRAMRDQPLALSLGQEAYMREIELKMGWQRVVRIAHYVYPLRSSRLLRGKVPAGPLAWTAAGILGTAARLRRALPSRAPAWTPELHTIEHFGPAHDELWSRVQFAIGCCVVRDASYLNWKYVDRQGSDFQLLELRRQDELVAVAVVALREADADYRYRRGFLVDLVVSPQERDVVWVLLSALREYFHDAGADAIHTYMASPALESQLRSFGFIEREAAKHLLVAAHGQDEVDALARIDSWLCTLGDSDLDSAVVVPRRA